MADKSRGVGLTYVRIRVGRNRHSTARQFRVLVDTGATISMLPGSVLKELGVVPREEVLVRLADGRQVPRGLGEAYVRYGKRQTHTWLLFGERGDASVLGALTLEELGLQVDPRSQTLRPVKVVLMVTARALRAEAKAT